MKKAFLGALGRRRNHRHCRRRPGRDAQARPLARMGAKPPAQAQVADAGPFCEGARGPGEVLHDLPRGAEGQAAALQGARQHPRGHLHPLPPRGEEEVQDRDVHEHGLPSTSASSAAEGDPRRRPICPTTGGAPRSARRARRRLGVLERRLLPVVRLASAKLATAVGFEDGAAAEEKHVHGSSPTPRPPTTPIATPRSARESAGSCARCCVDLGPGGQAGRGAGGGRFGRGSAPRPNYLTSHAARQAGPGDRRADQVADRSGAVAAEAGVR